MTDASLFQLNLVSVIIPTYNRASLLKEAVRSVADQSYRPIECIIVDDGSTDESLILIEGLKKTVERDDFKILYILQSNQGTQAARNKGTSVAKGVFIQYLDSDDLIYPSKLKEQVDYLLRHEKCDAVFGDWHKGERKNHELIHGEVSDDMISQMLVGRCIHTLSFLFRRSLVEKVGDWDPAISRNQEIDFHVRGLLLGAAYHYQPVLTGLWRTHSGNRIVSTTGLDDVVLFYQKMERLLRPQKLFSNELKERITSLYIWLISQHIDKPNHMLIKMLAEAKRLNPAISFYNSKMKLLALLFSERRAFHIWLSWFRFNQKFRNS